MSLFEQRELSTGQYFTPEWAADLLVERYFPDLGAADLVLEPSAGCGAFLKAIPAHVPAVGVEIDPALAAVAEANSGRRVIVGDFAAVELPEGVTAVIGNPPFEMAVWERFLARSSRILPECGRMGMVLPAYFFQTHIRTLRWLDSWSMRVDMIPRTLFTRLSLPIVFATFTKDRKRGMVGFVLYPESGDLENFREDVRSRLHEGAARRGVWHSVVDDELQRLGGKAHLSELYRAIEHHRPTPNVWWREKVRQILQLHFTPLGDGQWALPN
jgi:adenine-specific DNA-methyltransferase